MIKKDEVSNDEAEALMAGVQLAIFEVIWGSRDWIERIFLRVGDADVKVFFMCKTDPPDQHWETCCYLINEMLDVMIGDERVRDISWGLKKPQNEKFVEIMSNAIFTKIAEIHAPWRLPE